MTSSILGIGAVDAGSIALDRLDTSTLVHRSSSSFPNPQGKGTKSVYAIATDPGDPDVTVELVQNPNPQGFGGKGQRSVTIAVNSAIKNTDADGNVTFGRISATIGLTVQSGVAYEIADIRQMLQNVYCLTFDGQTAGVEDNGVLTRLLFGNSVVE